MLDWRSRLLTCFLLGLALLGCSKKRESETVESRAPDSVITLSKSVLQSGQVQIVPAELSALSDTLVLSGEIQVDPLKVARVSTRVSGTLQHVTGLVGNHVQRGQALASVYSPEYLAARSDYALASERAERAKQSGASDADALDGIAQSAAQRLKVLGATRADLETGLSDSNQLLSLRSPIAGVVTDVQATAGKQVEAGADLFAVADLSEVLAVVQVYEADVGKIGPGKPALLTATAYPGRVLRGAVASFEDALKEETRTLGVRIRIPNPALALKPGMFVTARVATGSSHQAMIVSEAAVQDLAGRKVVFVAVTDSQFVARPVQVRALGGDRIEIVGLAPGSRLATDGAFLLKSQALKGELGGED